MLTNFIKFLGQLQPQKEENRDECVFFKILYDESPEKGAKGVENRRNLGDDCGKVWGKVEKPRKILRIDFSDCFM